MKIGILTQPLGHNYGGLLQNWALQHVLAKIGYKSYTIIYYGESTTQRLISDIQSITKYIIKHLVFHPTRDLNSVPWDRKDPLENLRCFLKKNIRKTKVIQTLSNQAILKYRFKAIIVGSDQVWRPKYNKRLEYMFGKFDREDCSVPVVSYAASFGVDKWEFTIEQAKMAREQINKFQLVSVREDSAVKLCDKYLNTSAIQVLDPTLLLKSEDYQQLLLSRGGAHKGTGKIGVYFLDITDAKLAIVNYICKNIGMEAYYFGVKDLNTNKYCKVEDWIDSFNSCNFLITDSFHGTAFSINFKVPFITITNSKRGNSRLSSILNVFNLSDRLIEEDTAPIIISEILKSKINWCVVDNILESERAKSLSALSEALSTVCRF